MTAVVPGDARRPVPGAVLATHYRAVVFDLDGTLADTVQDIHEALVRALRGEGLPAVDVTSVRAMIGHGPRVLVERTLRRLGVPQRDELATRLTESFHAEARDLGQRHSRLFDGARTALEQLRGAGVRIGVCSNKPDDLCRLLLRSLEVDGCVDELLGSSDEMPRKPDPAILLRVIERLGVPPEKTLYVGDSATDVATARAAGVPVVLVSYGYSVQSASQLGADGVVDSLAELLWPGAEATDSGAR